MIVTEIRVEKRIKIQTYQQITPIVVNQTIARFTEQYQGFQIVSIILSGHESTAFEIVFTYLEDFETNNFGSLFSLIN